jgi:ParB-like chromosome segregation protein Spo0J
MSWRDEYKVHQAADVFPMLNDDELAKLGEDILANGLREPIKLMYVGKAKQIGENSFSQETVLIDGRNRLEAMERVGIDLESCAPKYQFVNRSRGPFDFDAASYIISLNIHRRHLNKIEQAELS